MKFLADVNVLFPLLISRHPHRAEALAWFNSAGAGEVALCRLVRLGALRLLSNAAVLKQDVLQPKAALEALEAFESEKRVVLVHEPDGVDERLKTFVASCDATPNLWTDAYLAAFAGVAGLKLVSFDRGFARFRGLDFLLLAAT